MNETFSIENISKLNDKLIATVYTSTSLGSSEARDVPLTKKVLQKAIEENVIYIRELEFLLGTKVSDFDNFIKAAFVGHVNYYVEFIPAKEVFTNFPKCPDLKEDEPREIREKVWKEHANKCAEVEYKFYQKLLNELPFKPLSAQQYIDELGSEKVAEMWNYVASRWGWNMDDFFEITEHYKLENSDIISNSPKFKRAVTSMFAVDMYDELMYQFSQGDNQGSYTVTLEEVLALPEE